MWREIRLILNDTMLLTWLLNSVILGELFLFAILTIAKKSTRKVCWNPSSSFYFILCVGLFVLSSTSVLSYSGTHELVRRLEVAMTRSGAVRDVVAEIHEMEGGKRGYLLTGHESQLVPYYRGRDSLRMRCHILDEAFRGHEDHVRAEALCRLAQVRAAEIERTVTLARKGDISGARSLVATNEILGTTERIRLDAEELASRAEAAAIRTRENIQVLSDVRVGMAMLLAAGSIVQMIFGAIVNLRPQVIASASASAPAASASASASASA